MCRIFLKQFKLSSFIIPYQYLSKILTILLSFFFRNLFILGLFGKLTENTKPKHNLCSINDLVREKFLQIIKLLFKKTYLLFYIMPKFYPQEIIYAINEQKTIFPLLFSLDKNIAKEFEFCHKLEYSNPYIFAE